MLKVVVTSYAFLCFHFFFTRHWWRTHVHVLPNKTVHSHQSLATRKTLDRNWLKSACVGILSFSFNSSSSPSIEWIHEIILVRFELVKSFSHQHHTLSKLVNFHHTIHLFFSKSFLSHSVVYVPFSTDSIQLNDAKRFYCFSRRFFFFFLSSLRSFCNQQFTKSFHAKPNIRWTIYKWFNFMENWILFRLHINIYFFVGFFFSLLLVFHSCLYSIFFSSSCHASEYFGGIQRQSLWECVTCSTWISVEKRAAESSQFVWKPSHAVCRLVTAFSNER